MFRYSGVRAFSLFLRFLGMAMMVGGAFSTIKGFATIAQHGMNYADPNNFFGWLSLTGGISAFFSGFSFLIVGQLLQVLADIAINTAHIKELVKHSQETTSFFARVANKTASQDQSLPGPSRY